MGGRVLFRSTVRRHPDDGYDRKMSLRLRHAAGIGLVVLACAAARAETTHGGVAPEEPDRGPEPSGAFAGSLKQGSPLPSSDDKATPAGSPHAGEKPTGASEALYLFAVGRPYPGAAFPAVSLALQDRLVAAVRRHSPEAIVRVLPELSLAELGRVSRAGLQAGRVLTVTVVLQGAIASHAPARILAGEGWVDEDELGRSLASLAKSLGVPCFGKACVAPDAKPEPAPLGFPRAALHVVWLASHAGSLDCAAFPGPVYGLTSADEERLPSVVEAWLSEIARRAPEFFPATAREWFDARLSRHRSAPRGWYCPHPGPHGFAGVKIASQIKD